MFGIEISYSWGEQEDGLYGSYSTETDAFRDMCLLAGKEAYEQNTEFWEEKPCVIYVDAFEKKVDLHYKSDDTWCYYRVKRKKEE